MTFHNERHIVLFGKTGAGKSSTANSILNTDRFITEVSTCSVTSQCQKESALISGRTWTVVDTPDFFYSTHEEDLGSEIERSVELSYPGIHAFLIIVPLTTFTEQEADIEALFEMSYGEEAFTYTIILFTHGDKLQNEELETLISQNQQLQNLVNRCGHRLQVLNNTYPADRQQQVTELLEKIDRMVSANGDSCYTLEMLHEAERRAEELKEMILEEKQREEERERMKHLRDLETAKQKTETRVRKQMEEVLEKIRAEVDAKKQEVEKLIKEEKEKKKKKKSYDWCFISQTKYLYLVTFFSVAVGCTLSKGSVGTRAFVHGCGLGASAALMGVVTGKTLILIWRTPSVTSYSSPPECSSLYTFMKKTCSLLIGGCVGSVMGYVFSNEPVVIVLEGLAGTTGALAAMYKSL